MGYGYGTFWGAQAGNGHHEWEMKTPVGLPVCPETREQGAVEESPVPFERRP